jgi:energy-coupling factor transporter ATP-binding protein EcfA2
MALIGTMLQDKGIKTMLIKRFIPIINHEVNAHLNHLGLFVNFHLDENFDETIKARGFDTLGYNSFSEGEKLRMDMALLLAWRDIARMQGNVSTNILIFDEIFDSSLDQGGAEALADLLGLVKDLNVFIVTHTPEKIKDKVRSTMKI